MSRRVCCRLLAVSLAAAAHAQQHDAAPRADAQLLLDLGDEERTVDAVRILTHRGAAGVTALMTAIADPQFRADDRRLAVAVYALGRMGDEGAPAASLLLDELGNAQGGEVRNLYWALGEIGPKAEAAGGKVLERLRRLKAVRPGYDYQEWFFACRRIEIGLGLSVEQIAEFLTNGDMGERLAVAGFLCREKLGSPLPRSDLLAAWTRSEREWRMYGESYKRVAMELARAVVLHAGDAPEATAARAALIYHFDVEVRLQAVMQMGQTPGKEPSASVKALQESLGDGSVHVRREAVTALGMIGPPAADALPALQKLTLDPDAQIRGRAAAAVRAMAVSVSSDADVLASSLGCDPAAVGALLRSGAPAAKALVPFLEHPDRWGADRKQAQRRALRLLRDLGADGADAVDALIAALGNRKWDEHQAQVFEAVAAIGPWLERRKELVVDLCDHSEEGRYFGNPGFWPTVAALQFDANAPAEALLAALDDKSPYVRAVAATALARCLTLHPPDDDAKQTFAERLRVAAKAPVPPTFRLKWRMRGTPTITEDRTEAPERVIAAIAEALAVVAPTAPESVPGHGARLWHSDPKVRREALLALGGLGVAAAPAVRGIAALLAADDHAIAAAAATTLGMLGEVAAPARADLAAASRSADKELAACAQAALRRLQ
jgi:HEAT repeat protein